MNWFAIVAIIFVIGNAIYGARKGFIRVFYSLVKWILVLAIWMILSPGVSNYLANHTNLQEKIAAQVEVRLEEKAQAAIEEKAQELSAQGEQDANIEDNLSDLELDLPSVLTEKIPSLSEATNEALVESGAYHAAAQEIATLALQGISGLLVAILAFVLIFALDKAFRIIEHLPVIKDVNQMLGLTAGFVKGMILLWTFLAVLALEIGTSFGQFFAPYVNASVFLKWLYENNFVLTILFAFV